MMGFKGTTQRRKRPCRRKRPRKYTSSSHWVSEKLLQTQGYYTRISCIWLPKIILPNTQPRAKKAAIVQAQDTEKASSQRVPTSHLMAQGHCVGNSRIWIPKRALPTSYVTSTNHEAIKDSDKGKQISQEPALVPMVLPIKDVKSTYQQGGSSCKYLENFSHPISIISPIS